MKDRKETSKHYVYRCGNNVVDSVKLKGIKPKGKKFVSVVIPTFFEEELIGKLIDSLVKNLKKYDYEIVIVDDNSQDKTPAIIDAASRKNPNVVALHRYRMKGVFSAQCDGIKICRGEVIVFMDADFSHPPEKIPGMLEKIKEGYDLCVGSRFTKGGGIIAPFMRRYPTTMLNLAIKIIIGLGMPVSDFTGVFHAMKKKKFEQIKFKYESKWGDFDMELLYRANKLKLKMTEIPFTYDYRKEGESKGGGFFSIIRYGWLYLSKAVKIRFLS